MTPADKMRDEFVRQWLLKAEEDLNAAKSLLSYGQTFISTVCFHSQQASEKYLKAFLTYHQVEFPKTHDIGELLDLAASVNEKLSQSLSDIILLTDYGVDTRYPGDFPSVSEQEAQQAVQLAQNTR